MKILEGNTPRWIIFLIDLAICLFSFILAYLLRFNFHIPVGEIETFKWVIPFVLTVRSLSFIFGRTYSNIIRYTAQKDILRIFTVLSIGSSVFVISNVVGFLHNEHFVIPFSIIVIDYLATTFLMISGRIFIRLLYFELKNSDRPKSKVIIYGAGESGLTAKRTLDRDAGTKYKVIGFIDDDPKKIGKKIEGIRIYKFADLDWMLENKDIAHVIISVQQLSPAKKQELVEKCFQFNTKVLTVPPVVKWINGELSFKQIKKVKIEDLLERDPIQLNLDNIKKQINRQVVLVTGGAGSIGSEIVRQVIKFQPEKLIVLDNAESPLYDIELELKEKGFTNFEIVIGDISKPERMRRVFDYFKPQLVYHAAAYKHVPMMENNPAEAIRTNVQGTKVVADLCDEYHVKKMVMVSTDKAVNPTNVMGASKRIAEIYVQSLSFNSKTKFITTRFGNVLGSNGSVIPRFKKQIEQGGPITITHPEITRYFMTIPEACQLVLEAGAMGNGGEIFIFDMGKSVKIVDLAKKMIRLSGLTLGKDIQIIYTGLRPGEKLYEELLNNEENTIPTHHNQILKAKVKEYEYGDILAEVSHLIGLVETQNNQKIVKKMKDIVPEFISNNSVYEKLDNKNELV